MEFIADIIKSIGLKPEQVKIVCSKNKNPGKGKKTNQAKLGEDYIIQEALGPPKKINFYTSTCFEGCDIHDENGKTFIVSDKNKSHTLVDISTLFIQICGRIRDSHYNTHVYHIFTETRYTNDVSLEEFKALTLDTMNKTESFVNEVNAMSDDNRQKVIKLYERDKEGAKDIKYVISNGDKLIIDKNLLKLDIINYKITHHLYTSRITLQEEYLKNDMKVDAVQEMYFTDKLKANRKARVSFKDLFIEYAEIRRLQPLNFNLGNANDRRSLIEELNPLIQKSYEILGVEKVKELGYKPTKINSELIRISDASKSTKIIEMVTMKLPMLQAIPVKEIKSVLQTIYDELEIIATAKATDLDKLFEIKKTTPKIDGKTVDCYTLIRPKIV